MRKVVLKKAIIIGLAIGFISLVQANESKAAVKEISCKTETIKWPVYNKSRTRIIRKNVKFKHRYFNIDGETKTVKIKLKTKQKKNLKV